MKESKQQSGYQEIPHTADWALQVWSPDLPGLFIQAAKGMAALMGMQLNRQPAHEYAFTVQGVDAESLLVAFLNELLFVWETEGLGFESLRISISENYLNAVMMAVPVIKVNKEIKAVTYHDLAISSSEDGFQTTIVFDV